MTIESCSVEEFRCLNGPCVDRKWICIYDLISMAIKGDVVTSPISGIVNFLIVVMTCLNVLMPTVYRSIGDVTVFLTVHVALMKRTAEFTSAQDIIVVMESKTVYRYLRNVMVSNSVGTEMMRCFVEYDGK
ncbi:uncharacterized protein [Ptychodera flava]|uniref:uncharacterized protein n=1 Tax=Ptychodera flava TaxID=63121 RepID=UPI003969CA88